MMREKVHKRRLSSAAPSNQTRNGTPPCRSQIKTETATPQKQNNVRFRSCFAFYKLLRKKKKEKKRNHSLLISSQAAEIIFSYQVMCFGELVHEKQKEEEKEQRHGSSSVKAMFMLHILKSEFIVQKHR